MSPGGGKWSDYQGVYSFIFFHWAEIVFEWFQPIPVSFHFDFDPNVLSSLMSRSKRSLVDQLEAFFGKHDLVDPIRQMGDRRTSRFRVLYCNLRRFRGSLVRDCFCRCNTIWQFLKACTASPCFLLTRLTSESKPESDDVQQRSNNCISKCATIHVPCARRIMERLSRWCSRLASKSSSVLMHFYKTGSEQTLGLGCFYGDLT